MSKDSPLKLISLTTLGTLLEWAEYTFYGYLALKLSHLFFPGDDPSLATLKAFGIFAVGYVMRPLGALIFGHIGDTYGRKPALVLSMLLMGFATFLIGCLPTYHHWGIFAPLCLLILRMLQGIAISGEFNGAGIFLIEKLGQKNPCLAGSWVSTAAAFGMVLGGTAAFIITIPIMPEWSWRVPFLLGGISCFFGMWFRRDINESSLFLQATRIKTKKREGLHTLLKHHMRSVIITSVIAAFTGIYVYILNIYMVSFLNHHVRLPLHLATFYTLFGEAVVFLLIPMMALLADRWDPRKQYWLSLLFIALTTPILFHLLLTGKPATILFSMVLYGILNGFMCGPIVKLLVDQFPVKLRYTGISFTWSLSAALFSGTAPMISQYLTTEWDSPMAPAYYVSLMACLALAILKLCRFHRPHHKPLKDVTHESLQGI